MLCARSEEDLRLPPSVPVSPGDHLPLCRFLVLLRHILWLYSRHQTRQPPETVEEKAWVFDGVRVALARRHQYAFGRPHTTRPVHSVTCRVAGTQFRDRLLIPHPHHRRALRRLLHAKEKGLVCCEQVRLLALWLQDETETGGWPLRPFVRLHVVSVRALMSAPCCYLCCCSQGLTVHGTWSRRPGRAG